MGVLILDEKEHEWARALAKRLKKNPGDVPVNERVIKELSDAFDSNFQNRPIVLKRGALRILESAANLQKHALTTSVIPGYKERIEGAGKQEEMKYTPYLRAAEETLDTMITLVEKLEGAL